MVTRGLIVLSLSIVGLLPQGCSNPPPYGWSMIDSGMCTRAMFESENPDPPIVHFELDGGRSRYSIELGDISPMTVPIKGHMCLIHFSGRNTYCIIEADQEVDGIPQDPAAGPTNSENER